MHRGSQMIVLVALAAGVVVGAATAAHAVAPQAPPPANPNGWQIPPDAPERKTPLTVDEKILAAGKQLFTDKCQRCHGPGGLGDGPDADPDHKDDMDLTTPRRAARNADGIVFYKVLNGRKRPKMPAFKDELTEEQIWQIVAYVQTLRTK